MLLTVNVTEYAPVDEKSTLGYCELSLVPPTKLYVEGEICQCQAVGNPPDKSVKEMVSPKEQVANGSAVNEAIGAVVKPLISGLCQTPRPYVPIRISASSS